MLLAFVWLLSQSQQALADSTGAVPSFFIPSITDINSIPVQTPVAGHQYVISIAFTNTNEAFADKPESSIFVVEVRDSSEFTTLVDWQSHVLVLGEKVAIGMSWMPQHPDTYHIRTFVLTNLTSPQLLLPPTTSNA